MKKTLRIVIPVVLAVAIVLCSAWYLLVYDREFTRDMLLTCARFSENQGSHNVATWFYKIAYAQAGNSDEVAIELANQYKSAGNYTKAEFTLSNAIADGGDSSVYIALCQLYIEQDKLLDAVNMLNNITNADIKAKLDSMRPDAPTVSPEPGLYNMYISATLQSKDGTIYYNPKGEYPSTDCVYTEPITLGDGETSIYAVAIGENGLVSPLSIFHYTIGGVIEKVEFSDTAIEKEIRRLLDVSDSKELFTNDLWKITSFTVPSEAKNYADIKHMLFLESLTIENGVSDQLQYLSALTSLEQLTIRKTAVSQDTLKTIAALPSLKDLTLTDASLSGVAPLKDATSITKLDLSSNTIRTIDAIGSIKGLQTLVLHGNAITDISGLSTNTVLISLDISTNNITSLAPISTLTSLTSLNASTNAISELGDIGKLTALTTLRLESNKLASVGSLSGCTNLEDLNLSSNTLTDITSLSTLTKLETFDFSYNQVTALPEFPDDSALVTITGSHNNVSTLKPLGGLKHLNTVNMDYNTEISSVSVLSNCPVLTRVNVYATKVTEVRVLTDQSIEVNYNPVQS